MEKSTIPTKEQIITLLYAWISQRPGLEFGNYGDVSAYRSEMRSITKDLAHARQLLRQVELSSITAEQLMDAFPRAYSGRLTLEAHPTKPGAWRLGYCTGQYWPTEYRAAACAVLASALWTHVREQCMPEPSKVGEDGIEYYDGMSAGGWIRRHFRREFGRGIQKRWFD